MGLAPGVLIRGDELQLGVIRRIHIHRGDQVTAFDKNPVRCADVSVAGVSIGIRWEEAGKGIHPGARTQGNLTPVDARTICIRASGA